MPKLKKSDEEAKDDIVRAVINYGMATQDIDLERLSLIIGTSRTTLWRRYKKPHNFTIEELRDICRKLKIPDDMKTKLVDAL